MSLPPLPGYADEGYDWMQKLKGWIPIPSWGEDGWDLGSWPYVVVAIHINAPAKIYAVTVYCEGDITTEQYKTEAEMNEAIDSIAEFHWRHSGTPPRDLPEVGLLPRHKGPYWGRKK